MIHDSYSHVLISIPNGNPFMQCTRAFGVAHSQECPLSSIVFTGILWSCDSKEFMWKCFLWFNAPMLFISSWLIWKSDCRSIYSPLKCILSSFVLFLLCNFTMEFYRQEYVVKKILTEIKPDERTE